MKIKVDKEQYEHLLSRVEQLEKDNTNDFERFYGLERRLRNYVDNYFENKCQVYVIKRDKEKIIAELRKQVLNNIFEEKDNE